MNASRIKKLIIRLLIVLTGLGLIFIHFVIPRVITQKRSALKSFIKGDPIYPYDHVFESRNNFKRKKISITSFDNLKLSGFITYSQLDSTKGTIILLPNSGRTKYFFLEMGEFLATNGYNSIAMDLRAFGESEGKFATYGVKEKYDIQSVIDYLINNENAKTIGIWGQSLGAAVALQAMGIDKRIKFGVSESTYTDFRTNMHTFFTRGTKVELPWFTRYLTNRSGKIGDFDPDDASPIKYAENITQPILIVHGENDLAFNIRLGKAIYNTLKSEDKTFIRIDGAGHTNVWDIGGNSYFNEVLSFFDRHSQK